MQHQDMNDASYIRLCCTSNGKNKSYYEVQLNTSLVAQGALVSASNTTYIAKLGVMNE